MKAVIEVLNCPVTTIMGIAYQFQSIGLRVFIKVLEDVSIFQPRINDAKWETYLRNAENRYQILMRNILPLYNLAVEPLDAIRLCPFSRGMPSHTCLIFSRSPTSCALKVLTETARSSGSWASQTSAYPTEVEGLGSRKTTPAR